MTNKAKDEGGGVLPTDTDRLVWIAEFCGSARSMFDGRKTVLQWGIGSPLPYAPDISILDQIRAAIDARLGKKNAGTKCDTADGPCACGAWHDASPNTAQQGESQWKVGDAFLSFHPDASHVPPDYRDGWNACYRAARAELSSLRAKAGEAERDNERMEDALRTISDWAKAYPLKVFPEPDFKKAHEALQTAGITLDAVSASCMRHVVSTVAQIANAALPKPEAIAARKPGQ